MDKTTERAAIHSLFPATPAPGELLMVAPGVHWVRMPLPFALDHINLWLLEDGEGWTLVDCGLASEETRRLWEQIFQDRLGGRPLSRLIVTHFHPDHVGLAGWLTERWGAPLLMTRTEWLYGRMLFLDTGPEMIERQVAFYRSAGCSEAYLALTRERGPGYAQRVSPIPSAYRRMVEGETIAIGAHAWQVVVGRGHAPEHACLHCPELDLLISGDQVLPRISPNVGVYASEPEADPLSDFLASLEHLKELPETTRVLPSHNTPFLGLHARLDQLIQHHEARLVDLVAALDRPKTAMELAATLFRRPLDHHQTGFAVGETLAHLHLLMARGAVTFRTEAEGLHRFERR